MEKEKLVIVLFLIIRIFEFEAEFRIRFFDLEVAAIMNDKSVNAFLSREGKAIGTVIFFFG